MLWKLCLVSGQLYRPILLLTHTVCDILGDKMVFQTDSLIRLFHHLLRLSTKCRSTWKRNWILKQPDRSSYCFSYRLYNICPLSRWMVHDNAIMLPVEVSFVFLHSVMPTKCKEFPKVVHFFSLNLMEVTPLLFIAIGGGSYWAGRAARPAHFLPLWVANVSGPPTFGHLIRPKRIPNLCSEFQWNSPCKSLSLYPLLMISLQRISNRKKVA